MTIAEAARDDAALDKRPAPSAAYRPPASPLLPFAWLLRAAALASVAAGIMGVIVAPGFHGNASEVVVVTADRLSASSACFLFVLLVPLVLVGIVELVRTREVEIVPRGALVAGAAAVVVIAMAGLYGRLPQPKPIFLDAAAAIATLGGAVSAARRPHTRALAGVLIAFAFAAIARLGAWVLAARAGDQASIQMFAWGRDLATAAILFEGAGQLLAVTWLGTRGPWAGQIAASAALVVAFIMTYGAASGVHSDAPLWQAVLHTALADAGGLPPPYGLDALATFLAPCALLLALVAAALRRQVVAVIAALALALVSRGAFDAPLRALCIVAAAQWATLAGVDGRAMWRTLIDDRSRRLAEAGPDNGTSSRH